MISAFTLIPEYRDYVWGGQRLRPGQLTAEAWIVYEGDRIQAGPWAGLTLVEAAAQHPTELLGRVPLARTGQRFPLLIKLLDCAQWLSVQVHPNDAQALALEGPGQFGKTEAWHFLQTEPGAEILAGLKPGTTSAALAQAVRGSGLLDVVQRVSVATGDTVFIPAGMLHALGPGMLLYEVQQTSNITYRVYDWDRPASAGRPLHLEQSLAVTNLALSGQVITAAADAGARQALIHCPYFTLEQLASQGARSAVPLDPRGESFQLLTLTRGSARLTGAGWGLDLAPLQTALVPAAAGAYQLQPQGDGCRALLAYVA